MLKSDSRIGWTFSNSRWPATLLCIVVARLVSTIFAIFGMFVHYMQKSTSNSDTFHKASSGDHEAQLEMVGLTCDMYRELAAAIHHQQEGPSRYAYSFNSSSMRPDPWVCQFVRLLLWRPTQTHGYGRGHFDKNAYHGREQARIRHKVGNDSIIIVTLLRQSICKGTLHYIYSDY